MAGACVEIKVHEIEALAQKLNGYALSARDEQSLLQSLGVELEAQMSERIESTKTDPAGTPWAAIANSTKAYLLRYFPTSRPPLWRTGGLLDSIESKVSSGSILSGATKAYAEYLQDGTRRMVPRKFAGLSTDDIADLADLIDVFVQGRIT